MNDIQKLFFEDDGVAVLHCPYCDYDYVHMKKPLYFSGNDNYEAQGVFGVGGRGDVNALLFEGECGHEWALAFGFHKGQIYYTVTRRSEESILI